jgi:acyl carrier protein
MSPDLRPRLAELIRVATDGALAPQDVLAGGALYALGLDSLGTLRLVDAIEDEFDVTLDLGAGATVFETVDTLAAHLHGLLPAPHERTNR